MKTIYLDNNATTQPDPQVLEVMEPFWREEYFNPSSMYTRSKVPARAIAAARRAIADTLGGVESSEIIFTSCATESNNAAIFGAINATSERRHIITSAVEHPAVLETCREAERRGCELSILPVDRNGLVEMDTYIRALREDTLLVSIIHANNETGVILPIEEMARLAKETDERIIFHTDATQSIGKLPVDLKAMDNIDLLSFSGHKLHAPKGVGALFVRRGTRVRPFLVGGHQENGRRAGTENVAFIVGLAKACELAREHMQDEHRLSDLRDRLQRAIAESVPAVEINGAGAPRLPNTLNIACHGVEGEAILYELDEYGICASSGSACTSGSLDSSHVLKAMGVPFSAIHGSVRFSLSRFNTEQEIDYVAEVFPDMIARLRKMSPFWDEANKCAKI
jgi:cysteine desulfurase